MITDPLPQWLLASTGGLMIGLAAAGYLLFNGRVAGISGMVARVAGLSVHGQRGLSTLFLGGLLLGTGAATLWLRAPALVITSTPGLLLVAGLLVGYGTRLGGGCTSGHGVCGMARLSRRSLVATAVFMATAVATVAAMRLASGGTP